MKTPHILLALGANLPSDAASQLRFPAETLGMALESLGAQGLRVTAQSPLYATPCYPPGAGPDYVNSAACLTAPKGMTPAGVLAILHRIEAAYGRTRSTRWAGRSLDLDLLAFADLVLPDAATQDFWRALSPEDQARLTPDQLILPHPRLSDRAFVLVPLADIAPDWVHPRLGQSVLQMLHALPQADRDAVRRL